MHLVGEIKRRNSTDYLVSSTKLISSEFRVSCLPRSYHFIYYLLTDYISNISTTYIRTPEDTKSKRDPTISNDHCPLFFPNKAWCFYSSMLCIDHLICHKLNMKTKGFFLPKTRIKTCVNKYSLISRFHGSNKFISNCS